MRALSSEGREAASRQRSLNRVDAELVADEFADTFYVNATSWAFLSVILENRNLGVLQTVGRCSGGALARGGGRKGQKGTVNHGWHGYRRAEVPAAFAESRFLGFTSLERPMRIRCRAMVDVES